MDKPWDLREEFREIVHRASSTIAHAQGQRLLPASIEALYDLVVEVLEVTAPEPTDEDVPARYSMAVPKAGRPSARPKAKK